MQNEIFGYSFKEICAMQQKTYTKKPAKFEPKKEATEADLRLLEEHGKEGLERLQFYGVLDRLNLL